MTFIFWYSAIAYLTLGYSCNHFCIEISIFLSSSPEALFYTVKPQLQIKDVDLRHYMALDWNE